MRESRSRMYSENEKKSSKYSIIFDKHQKLNEKFIQVESSKKIYAEKFKETEKENKELMKKYLELKEKNVVDEAALKAAGVSAVMLLAGNVVHLIPEKYRPNHHPDPLNETLQTAQCRS